MSYLDIGFDENLSRIDPGANQTEQQPQELDPLAFERFTDVISGSKIQGGAISSPDGKVKVDLENGVFKVNNGLEDLVSLGILPDGSVGLLIKDNKGNILMQISSDKNIIQSPNEHFQVDFVEERILAKDAGGTPRVLIGKGDF